MSGERFAHQLRVAEERLRASGLTGRAAFAALCRSLAERLGLEERYWPEGPDAPASVGLDRLPLTAELDLFGLSYERFFSDVFKAERGQFFTPRPLVELMADLAEIRTGERVLDPTCGSGSFLISALARGADVDGIEIDPELVALCRINLVLHGGKPGSVVQGDLFRALPQDETWDVILANPPFSVVIDDAAALEGFSLPGGRQRVSSDILFVEAAWRLLRPGGRLVVLLPRSILANSRYVWVRRWMDERFVRRAIVSLPEGVFRPFGGASSRASILALAKRPAELKPWVGVSIQNPGFNTRVRSYRRTEPDEIAQLRIALRDGTAKHWPRASGGWLPEAQGRASGIAPDVPRSTLDQWVRRAYNRINPAETPDEPFTEVDLKDIDKQTGEVTGARTRIGAEFKGSKAVFSEGDILFARIRPNLNNVVLVTRPRLDLPGKMCGSSEWVRLEPAEKPHFTLIAVRSCFVRNQLRSTEGQTRPRIRANELDDVEIPEPSDPVRGEIDDLVRSALEVRWHARQVLEQVSAAYEAFGRGELSDDELKWCLEEIRAGSPAL